MSNGSPPSAPDAASPSDAYTGSPRIVSPAAAALGLIGTQRYPLCCRYFIAKDEGRRQSVDAPTTAIVLTEPRISRR